MLTAVSAPLVSTANVTAITGNKTLSFLIKTPASFTGGALWSVPSALHSQGEPYQISFVNSGGNKIYFQAACDRFDDPYIWSVPASVSTWYRLTIRQNFGTSGAPSISLNGVAQTVTLVQTGDSVGNMATAIWTLGGGLSAAGEFGSLAWWSGSLSNADDEKLGLAAIHDMPLYISPSTLVQYTPFDDVPVGEYTAQSNLIVPNGDVVNTFASGNYASLAADDASSITIDKNDDNKTCTFAYSTFTIPAGHSAFGSKTTVKGVYDDSGVNQLAGVHLIKGGGGTTASWIPSLSSSPTTVSRIEYSSWTQNDIDGCQISITSPAMSKDGDITLNYTPVEIFTRRAALRNYVGSNEFMSAGNAVLSTGLYGPGWGY